MVIKATLDGKPFPRDSKVASLVWDVESQWDRPGVELSSEVRWGGTGVQVILPDASGIVRVQAVGLVSGKLTPFVRTTITLDYKALPTPTQIADKAIPKKAGTADPVVTAYLIIDVDSGDADQNGVILSGRLKNDLRIAGIDGIVLKHTSPQIERLGLTGPIRDAGGVPALVLVTASGKVFRATAAPKTLQAILEKAKVN